MFRGLLLAASLFLFATPVAAQQADPVDMASKMAANMQSIVGQQFEGGVTVVSVASDGPMLIVRFGGPDGWRGTLTADEISDAMMGGFCKEAAVVFTYGVRMRVDSIDNGSLIRGSVITSCPAE